MRANGIAKINKKINDSGTNPNPKKGKTGGHTASKGHKRIFEGTGKEKASANYSQQYQDQTNHPKYICQQAES